MKNPSFGALHSPFPNQSEIQGRSPVTSSFAWLCEISHTMQNHLRQPMDFAHHAKFLMVCEIFLCTDSVRFLSSDILCNFLVSPCNQPRYFLLYLFIYLLGNIIYRGEDKGRREMVFFIWTLVKILKVRNIQSFCSVFPSHFVFTFLSSKTTFVDDFSRDEWLGFTFLGVMEVGWRTRMQR